MLAELGVNGLSIYPQAGLILFLGVFLAVSARALRCPRDEARRCARMPLDETTTSVDDTKQVRRGV